MNARKNRKHNSRARDRAQLSCFIFVMFFAVFGLILMANLVSEDRKRNAPSYEWQRQTKSTMETTKTNEKAPPAIEPKDAVWQPVVGLSFKFFVYSAFMERETANVVRIIAAARTHQPGPVLCKLWLHNRTYTLPATVQAIRENWNLKYSASFVLCMLRKSGLRPDDTIGGSIAVLAENRINEPHTNLLRVLDTRPVPATEQSVHVCVKPMHYKYSKDCWLLEWLEMNIQLGVSHFYMYNESLSPSVECILKHYKEQSLITILPWNLQFKSQVEIRTLGMFAAWNDCLYRSMSRAAWLLVIDLDELVIPRRAHTLQQLLADLTNSYVPTRPNVKPPAAFLFRNAFFYLKWDDDPSSKSWLVTSRKTRRWATPHAANVRSKYAVRPAAAVELGNHFLWQMRRPYVSAVAPMHKALSHHYRAVCEFGGNTCMNVPSVVDHAAVQFTNPLEHRMNERLLVLRDICTINDACGR